MTFRFKLHLRVLFLIACASTFLISTQVMAEVSIAVVDIEKILIESKAAISIKQQVETKRKGFMASVKAEEDKLRIEQKAIEAKRKDLSQEDLLAKAQDFEKRRIKARNSIQSKKTGLDKAYGEAMNTLTKVIYDVCQTIANEKEIDLVITRQNIIVGNMSLDITKDVLSRMNKKLPSLTLQAK